MKKLAVMLFLLLALGLPVACSRPGAIPNPVTPTLSASPTEDRHGLSEAGAKTLASLQKVDDYPLYVMQYFQDSKPAPASSPSASRQFSFAARQFPFAAREPGPTPAWACSLFTVLLDADHLLYGRNFDWQYSPALLLFTHPPDGFASVSMVDITYLGFSGETASSLVDLPLEARLGLLDALSYPFDGMNARGLAIGMAAVPSGNMPSDPSRQSIGSLEIIREILDHAADVDQAVELIRNFNIDFSGGPPVHYLIADANKKAVLVEFYQGQMVVFQNEQPWHSATNFLQASVEDPRGNCYRYDHINARLNAAQGLLDSKSAMQLLAEVAQDGENSTRWSVVYQMARQQVSVAMGRDYNDVHTFRMSDYLE